MHNKLFNFIKNAFCTESSKIHHLLQGTFFAYLRPAAFVSTSVRAVVGADDEQAMPLILSTPCSKKKGSFSTFAQFTYSFIS
jgi:hypothetical protein